MTSAPSPEASPELRTYRVVCLLVAVLVPVFGYSFHWRDPMVADPIWLRWVLGALPLSLVVGTYVSEWVRNHLKQLGPVLIYVFVTWSAVITALNNLVPEYALGHLLVVLMIGVATPDTVPLRTTMGCLLYTVVTSALASFPLPAPAMDPWVFFFCVATAATVIFVGVWLRLEMRSRLQASEVRYRTVFDNTTDGLFLTDAETHRFLHANEAYLALTGYAPDELRALTLHDVAVAPQGFIEEKSQDLLIHGQVTIGEQQHRRKDGTLLDLMIGVNVIEQDGGTVFCTTAHDLTEHKREHKRIEAEKERARAHIEEMLRMKSALLDTMSHELRTPLAGILGFTEILAEEVTEEQHDLVQALHQNAHRLSETLNALLDLAQLRGGETKINIEVVDVAEAANEVADMFRHRIEAKGLRFRVETTPAARSQLDREALRRLLSHLLSNATKFTEQGEVTLLVETDSRRVFIRVIDTGIGMHEDDVPTLFNAFEQASTGLYRIHEGTGLGLSITRQLIDLMGGQVKVQSTLGVGTTFTVSFARTWASPEDVLDQPRPIQTADPTSEQSNRPD